MVLRVSTDRQVTAICSCQQLPYYRYSGTGIDGVGSVILFAQLRWLIRSAVDIVTGASATHHASFSCTSNEAHPKFGPPSRLPLNFSVTPDRDRVTRSPVVYIGPHLLS